MEEAKAAAYYEELVAKGGGAARFKQGLGFSSAPAAAKLEVQGLGNFVRAAAPGSPGRDAGKGAKGGGSARFKQGLGFSSAPAAAKPEVQGLGNFVRAAGPGSPGRDAGKGQASRLEGSQDDGRLSKHGRHRSRSPLHRECRSRDRSNSRERSRDDHRRSSKGDRSHNGDNSRRHSHRRDSRSPSGRDSYHKRDRSLSPRSRRDSSGRDDSERRHRGSTESRKGSRDRDYSKLIRNYESMTPAERVKAKLSLQLSETAAKDKDEGMSDGWERFDFDKNARLDDDVEPDYNVGDRTGAPDDTAFLKNTSQSFLSYASQATREKRTEAAHEAAIFGVPAANTLDNESASQEDINLSRDSTENKAQSHVVSEQVIAMQQDSWQERARKMKAAKSAAAAAT